MASLHEQILNKFRTKKAQASQNTGFGFTPIPKKKTSIFSRENLEAAKNVARGVYDKSKAALGEFGTESAKNVRDVFTGKLKATPGDYKAGAVKVIEPTARFVKGVAQETFGGISRLGKTAIESTGAKAPSNPKLETALFGRPTGTYQETYKKASETLGKFGASNTEKKIGAGVVAVGSLFLDLPGGTTGKTLFKNIAEQTSETVIASLLKREVRGITDETAALLARDLKNISNPKEVERFIASKVKSANELSGITGTKKYSTVHDGGVIKTVEGKPVKVVDGVETFIHKGDGGWIVSEASTGRFLSESRTADGAIAKAKFNIDNVGRDEFLSLLEKNKLSDQNIPPVKPGEMPTHEQIVQARAGNRVPSAQAVPDEASARLQRTTPQDKTPLELGKERTGPEGLDPFGRPRQLPGQTIKPELSRVPQGPLKPKSPFGTILPQKPPKKTEKFTTLKKAKTSIVEYVQNEAERVRQLVARKDVKVSDTSDPYLKMTLYHGRVGAQVDAAKKEAEKAIADMKILADKSKNELTAFRKKVAGYLKARHAPERNIALGDGAAGITTKQAKAELDALESSLEGPDIKRVADQIQGLNNKTLEILKDSGVITDELYDLLKKKYKYHVPLNRIFDDTDDVGTVLSGKGFNVSSTGIKGAKGSSREVDDVLANIMLNHEQAILRAEKNIVDQATLEFARNNKDVLGDLLEISRPKPIGKSFDGKILLEKSSDPSVLQMFEKGKPVWIKIKDPHLAVALRGVGKEKIGGLLNVVAKVTRLYSGLATRFNPEFALPNKLRDLQETAVYLAAQKDVGFKGAAGVVARDAKSMKDVLDSLRGIDSEGANLYKEMKSLGGTTGGFGLSTKEKVKLSLERLESLEKSKTKKVINNLIEYVDNWNTLFEDSTRLSVYKQALSQGVSKDRAAALAKEASINFNRMGKGGPVINALWMFANASIQGSTKTLKALKNPKVLGATVMAVGSSVAAVNEWNDRVDPEWRNKVPKWDRLNSLPVMIPSTDGGIKYVSIPVSWGIKPIKVMSDYAYDALSGHGFNAENMLEDTTTAILEAYNPVGGTDLVSAVTPSILDTPVDISRNRSWSGSKIRPDFDPNAPKDIQYFSSLDDTAAGRGAISLTELLQDKAGVAISPANIKYSYDQLIGGAGRAVSKTVNFISGFATKKPVPLDEYPMLSRFYRERAADEIGQGAGGDPQVVKDLQQGQSRDRFKLKNDAVKLDEELQGMSPEEANRRYQQIKTENPELFEKLKDVVADRKLGLTTEEKQIKQLGVENGVRAKYIDGVIMKLPKEKRAAYYEELRKKRIITEEVAKQIRRLRNQTSTE
jgi:hypothetical protein